MTDDLTALATSDDPAAIWMRVVDDAVLAPIARRRGDATSPYPEAYGRVAAMLGVLLAGGDLETLRRRLLDLQRKHGGE